ncbi:MAG: hypothetical protein WA230_20520 [Xanthobacteraceae bacterium]
MTAAFNENLPEVLKNVRARPLFRLSEQVPPLHVVGQTPNAFRRIGVITGGAIAGERLSGEVISPQLYFMRACRSQSGVKLRGAKAARKPTLSSIVNRTVPRRVPNSGNI